MKVVSIVVMDQLEKLHPRLMKALGHEVIELFCEIDGNFPNHHPDPGKPENLNDLIEAVHEI